MKSRFLLDTDTLSEPLRPAPSRRLLELLAAHRTQLATASVVLHEMVYGMAKLPASRRRAAIQSYLEEVILASITILPYDLTAARWHGEERARLESIGRPLPYRDSQIAAIARVHDLVLVTSNTKDFAGVDGLKVEDWR